MSITANFHHNDYLNPVYPKMLPNTLSQQSQLEYEVFLKSVQAALSLDDADSRNQLRSLLNNITKSSNKPLKNALEPIRTSLNDYLENRLQIAPFRALVLNILRNTQ